jgi:hypothetical protein
VAGNKLSKPIRQPNDITTEDEVIDVMAQWEW